MSGNKLTRPPHQRRAPRRHPGGLNPDAAPALPQPARQHVAPHPLARVPSLRRWRRRPKVYGGGARNYAKGTTTTTNGASSLSSVASSPGRRLRRHHHHAAAVGSDSAYPYYGRYGDEAHAIGLVSVARGSKWDMAAEAVDGAGVAGAGTGAFGYDARVTTATTAKGGSGVSDDGDEGSSEDGVLLPAPPRMAITKRTDVVVMR